MQKGTSKAHAGSNFRKQLHFWDWRTEGRDWGSNHLDAWKRVLQSRDTDLQEGATA